MDEFMESLLPEDWELGSYGDTVICPCGNEIEIDGECYCGKKSPFIGVLV